MPEEYDKRIDQLTVRNLLTMAANSCCGLRVSEARKLKLEDIDFERKTALILRSKGDKDRLIYIADDVCNMCLDMLDLLHDKLLTE